jgi:hypothetical protein
MATDANVCTVFGATGLQGGSVARYLAESGLFAELRLVSRDISKESALAIKAECEAKGAKVTLVCANLDDEVSMDAALAGATHSFLVTNWWELFFANGAVPGVEGFVSGKKAQAIEEAQGYRWVDLCKKHALEFVVYSGLCDAEKLSGFKNIYHFQGKAKVLPFFKGDETLYKPSERGSARTLRLLRHGRMVEWPRFLQDASHHGD